MSILSRISRLFVYETEEPQEKRGFLEYIGTSIDELISNFGVKRSKAGQDIDVETVLGLSAVWRAVTILADSIASLPIEVIRKDSNGNIIPQPNHPVNRLLSIEPHPIYTPYTFIHTLVANAALFGNAYTIIQKERVTRYPKKLVLVSPDRVVGMVMENDTLVYRIDDANKTYKAENVLHFGGLSWNGVAGLNVLDYLKDNFGLALANQEYLAKFFADGAALSGVLKHPGRLTDASMKRLQLSWSDQYGGAKNSGKTAILEEGMEFQPIGLSPQQAAASETKKLTIADISRIFGVPQFLLEDLDRATFNNIEHLSLLFIKHTVRPWVKRIEAELNRKLFPKDEQGEYMVRFDLDDLLMSDLDSRGKYVEIMMKWGVLNRDEIRQREGYNPIADGSGQKYFVPMNMQDPAEPNENTQPNENGNTQDDPGPE